jgi:hypothetical protein
MIDARLAAGEDLGIEVVALFLLETDLRTIECPALILNFGRANGTVVLPIDAPESGRLRSLVEDVSLFSVLRPTRTPISTRTVSLQFSTTGDGRGSRANVLRGAPTNLGRPDCTVRDRRVAAGITEVIATGT